MNNVGQKVAVIGGLRTPFVRSFREYSRTTNQEMLTACIHAVVKKYNLQGVKLGDVGLGAVMKSSVEWNLAREVVLGTGLHPSTPAFNIQRACGTSMEAVDLIALKIATGQIDSGIAAGSDTNSDLPVMVKRDLAWKLIDINQAKSLKERVSGFLKIRFKDLFPSYPGIVEPRTGMSMGQHTEKMVKEWKISRDDQDQLALESHQKAVKAYEEGFYNDLVIPFKEATLDTIVRADTNLEKLSRLKPSFDFSVRGTLTAGNSTALSDGAAAVFLCSDKFAQKHNLPIESYLVDVQTAAVDFVHGAGLLLAPALAVGQLLKRNKLKLQEFDS
jgi:acetyl-CoA C-acetyltransferase